MISIRRKHSKKQIVRKNIFENLIDDENLIIGVANEKKNLHVTRILLK